MPEQQFFNDARFTGYVKIGDIPEKASAATAVLVPDGEKVSYRGIADFRSDLGLAIPDNRIVFGNDDGTGVESDANLTWDGTSLTAGAWSTDALRLYQDGQEVLTDFANQLWINRLAEFTIVNVGSSVFIPAGHVLFTESIQGHSTGDTLSVAAGGISNGKYLKLENTIQISGEDVSATPSMFPMTTNHTDLGSVTYKYKQGFFEGTVAGADATLVGEFVTLGQLNAVPVGTVTSVSAGNGMDFTTITDSGAVTMGTPSTLTTSTTNALTTTSHTHAITGFATTGDISIGATHVAYGNATSDGIEGVSSFTWSGTQLVVSGDIMTKNAGDKFILGIATPGNYLTHSTTEVSLNSVLDIELVSASDKATIESNIASTKIIHQIVKSVANTLYPIKGEGVSENHLGTLVYPWDIIYVDRLISAAPIGIIPFEVVSTTMNPNLNADLLDGYHASHFQVAGTYDNYVSWNLYTDTVLRKAVIKDGTVNIVGGTDIDVVYSGDGVITLNNAYTPGSDEYVDVITFSTVTGDLTLGRNVGANLVQNLDGRYSLTSHNHDSVYVNVTGDAMTGDLDMNNNAVIFGVNSITSQATALYIDAVGYHAFFIDGSPEVLISDTLIRPWTGKVQDLGESTIPFGNAYIGDSIYAGSSTAYQRTNAAGLWKYNSAWGAGTSHHVLHHSYTGTVGDYLYLSAPGNQDPTLDAAIIIGDIVGFAFGKGNATGSELTTTKFGISPTGVVTITSPATGTSDSFLIESSGVIQKRDLSTIVGAVPATPGSLTLTEFSTYTSVSWTGDTSMDYYEIWQSQKNSTESFVLIGLIKKADIIATITFLDNTYNTVKETFYKVYAVKGGVSSLASSNSITLTNVVADVTGVEIIEDAHHIHIMWENPDDIRWMNSEVKIDFNSVEGSLSEAASTLIYTGRRSSYFYKIPDANRGEYFKVWVNPNTRT